MRRGDEDTGHVHTRTCTRTEGRPRGRTGVDGHLHAEEGGRGGNQPCRQCHLKGLVVFTGRQNQQERRLFGKLQREWMELGPGAGVRVGSWPLRPCLPGGSVQTAGPPPHGLSPQGLGAAVAFQATAPVLLPQGQGGVLEQPRMGMAKLSGTRTVPEAGALDSESGDGHRAPTLPSCCASLAKSPSRAQPHFYTFK